jgi:hypothetical protein
MESSKEEEDPHEVDDNGVKLSAQLRKLQLPPSKLRSRMISIDDLKLSDAGYRRKLSSSVRTANVVYQLGMFLFGLMNILLVILKGEGVNVPNVFFEVVSIGLSFLPLAWSKYLDMMKKILGGCNYVKSEMLKGDIM